MSTDAHPTQAEVDELHAQIDDFLQADQHVTEVRASEAYVRLLHEEIGPEDYAQLLFERTRADRRDRAPQRTERKRELEEQLTRGEAWAGARTLAAALRARWAALVLFMCACGALMLGALGLA
jgi:hypothetical protein